MLIIPNQINESNTKGKGEFSCSRGPLSGRCVVTWIPGTGLNWPKHRTALENLSAGREDVGGRLHRKISKT